MLIVAILQPHAPVSIGKFSWRYLGYFTREVLLTMRGLDLTDDVAKIEEFSVELECELLHAPVLGKL